MHSTLRFRWSMFLRCSMCPNFTTLRATENLTCTFSAMGSKGRRLSRIFIVNPTTIIVICPNLRICNYESSFVMRVIMHVWLDALSIHYDICPDCYPDKQARILLTFRDDGRTSVALRINPYSEAIYTFGRSLENPIRRCRAVNLRARHLVAFSKPTCTSTITCSLSEDHF